MGGGGPFAFSLSAGSLVQPGLPWDFLDVLDRSKFGAVPPLVSASSELDLDLQSPPALFLIYFGSTPLLGLLGFSDSCALSPFYLPPPFRHLADGHA